MKKYKTMVWLVAVAVLIGATCSHAREFSKTVNNASEDYAKVGVASPDGERLVASESLECDRSSANRENISDDPERADSSIYCEMKQGTKRTSCARLKTADKVVQAVEALREGCVGCDRRVKLADNKTIPVVCAECDVQSRK